jgi:hypothetical protein
MKYRSTPHIIWVSTQYRSTHLIAGLSAVPMADTPMVDISGADRGNSRSEQLKLTVSETHKALVDIKNAAMDSWYIERERKRPVDLERGHALFMRWSRYSHRAPQMILFAPDGKILLSLRVQRLAKSLVKRASDINISGRLEARAITKSRLYLDDLEEFKTRMTQMRELLEDVIKDPDAQVRDDATKMVNEVFAHTLEVGQI